MYLFPINVHSIVRWAFGSNEIGSKLLMARTLVW